MPTRRTAIAIRLIAGLALGASLSGCSLFSAPPQVRGNQVRASELKLLVPGTSTEGDAQSLLGSPTVRAPFDPNTWIYVSEITRPQVGRIQAVERQHVVALTFDSNGVLKRVRQETKTSALPVTMAAGTTPSPGSNPNILEQLIGNVGRYAPAKGNSGFLSSGPTIP